MKRFYLSNQEKAFADLIFEGWSATKAYPLLFPTKAKGSSISVLASRLKSSPLIREYLNYKLYKRVGIRMRYEDGKDLLLDSI